MSATTYLFAEPVTYVYKPFIEVTTVCSLHLLPLKSSSTSLLLPCFFIEVFASSLQIGDRYVVDCSVEEELCSSCQLSAAVSKDGILSTSLEGGGGIPYDQLNDIIEVSLTIVYMPRSSGWLVNTIIMF